MKSTSDVVREALGIIASESKEIQLEGYEIYSALEVAEVLSKISLRINKINY